MYSWEYIVLGLNWEVLPGLGESAKVYATHVRLWASMRLAHCLLCSTGEHVRAFSSCPGNWCLDEASRVGSSERWKITGDKARGGWLVWEPASMSAATLKNKWCGNWHRRLTTAARKGVGLSLEPTKRSTRELVGRASCNCGAAPIWQRQR